MPCSAAAVQGVQNDAGGEHSACHQDSPMETGPESKLLAGVMLEVFKMGFERLSCDFAGNESRSFGCVRSR